MNSKFVGLLLMAFVVVAVDWAAKPTFADDRLARNVILFIGDAGGIPTINAAAIYNYARPGSCSFTRCRMSRSWKLRQPPNGSQTLPRP